MATSDIGKKVAQGARAGFAQKNPGAITGQKVIKGAKLSPGPEQKYQGVGRPHGPHGTTPKAPTSRMGAITASRKKGGLIGMPINGAGIDYSKGKWTDNTGRVFATADNEDTKPKLVTTPLQKAARAKRISMRGK